MIPFSLRPVFLFLAFALAACTEAANPETTNSLPSTEGTTGAASDRPLSIRGTMLEDGKITMSGTGMTYNSYQVRDHTTREDTMVTSTHTTTPLEIEVHYTEGETPQYVFTIDGETYEVTSDKDGFWFDHGDQRLNFFAEGGILRAFLNAGQSSNAPASHVTVLQNWSQIIWMGPDETVATHNRTHYIFGDKTAAADLPTSGSLDLSGKFKMYVTDHTMSQLNSNLEVATGPIDLTVKASGNALTLEGSGENWENDTVDLFERFDIVGTQIDSDGAFSTTIQNTTEYCGDSCTEFTSSEFSGALYGPDGNETAGNIILEMEDTGGLTSAAGFFIAAEE